MEGQGSQQFTINDLSTLHLNQEAHGSINENNAVQITDPFAIPNTGAPTTRTQPTAVGPTRPFVPVNGQTATPFQDLLAAARTEPRPQGGSSRVQPEIDLNQAAESDDPGLFSNGSSNASPLVISSGVAGYVVEEGQGGDNRRRLSCKRRATEEPGESSRLVDETPVIHIEDDEEEPEQQQEPDQEHEEVDIDDDVNVDGDYFRLGYEAPFVLDQNLANSYEHQVQYVARPVVLGLAAPTQMDRDVQFLRDRIIVSSRQISQHIPEYRQAMAQRDSTFGLQAPQPAYFPYASAPGGFHPIAPPPSHHPITNPYIPDFGEPGEPYWTQVNRQVVWPGVPHVPVSPVNFTLSDLEATGNVTSTVVHQYGFLIPDGALTPAEALTRAHYCPHHLGYPIDPRMMEASMRGGFAGTQQSIGPRISRPRVSVQIDTEIAIRAAAHTRPRQNIRAALERIRANQANRDNLNQEGVMVIDPVAQFGGNEEQPVNENQEMEMNVEEMSYEELMALEERLGSVTSRIIDSELKPYKYGLAASTSSSTNDQCCICQDEYNAGEDVTSLNCGHIYHFGCIKMWLMQKNNCPICKRAALPASN